MTDPETSPGPSANRGPRLWLAALGLVLLVALAVYIWKLVAVDRVEDAMEVQRDSLVEAGRATLDARTQELLRLSAVPLGFAIREPVVDGNYDLVDRYLSALVQEPGVRQAMFLGAGDSILVATNRSLRGRPVSAAGLPEGLLPATETTVRRGAEGRWLVAVPVTGINRSVGTLVVEYLPESVPEPTPPEDAGEPAPQGGAPGADSAVQDETAASAPIGRHATILPSTAEATHV